MNRQKHPNTFIIGAPKTGSTSIARMLGQHPQAFLPVVKEPKYYCPEFYMPAEKRAFYTKNKDGYLSLYKTVPENVSICIDASVNTMYSASRGVKSILEDCPDAKIIIILRNPIDAAISMYNFRNKTSYKDFCPSFELAWADCKNRYPTSKYNKKLSHNVLEYNYKYLFQYGDFLDEIIANVPQKNIHFILYDDINADVKDIYSKLCRFLSIDDTFNPELKKINSLGVPRFAMLKSAIDIFKPITYPLRCYLRLNKVNITELLFTSRKSSKLNGLNTISEKTREDMLSEFLPSINKVEALLGRDLSNWKV